MKKLLLTTLFVILSLGLVTAADATSFPFKPISARTEGMGGAGVATAKATDSLFMNPATLAHGKFSLNMPSVSLTVFNVLDILNSDIPQIIETGGDDMPLNLAMEFLNKIVTAGRGEILTTDVGVSFTGGGFGLGVNVQEQLHTISSDGSLTNDKIIAEVNVAAPIGLGFRFNLVPDAISLDVGASVKFVYRAYTQKIGAVQLTSLVESDDPMQSLMENTLVTAGWALPIDIGVNLNLPVGLRVSAVARNINGNYNMKDYTELGGWLNEMTSLAGMDPIYQDNAPATDIGAEYAVQVPWTLDAGFGWAPYIGKALQPSLAVDLSDVLGVIDGSKKLLDNASAGVELKLLSFLTARAGINKGYYSVGVGLDLLIAHLDVSYFVREFGVEIGDKRVDALTIRFNLGVDGQ